MVDWDSGQYLKFEDERTRPAADLLRRVPLTKPARVADIGCGPGNSTALLLERFPDARVEGIDSSPTMIAEARSRLPGVGFRQLDLQAWNPVERLDLIYGNAVLQWLPGHGTLLPRLVSFLMAGGCLAIQMPDNLDEPSHVLMEKVAREGPWAKTISSGAMIRETLRSLDDYYALLQSAGCVVDIWRTTYVHPLEGPAAIVEWFKSTGLKRYLDPLSVPERSIFLSRYEAEIAKAFPRQADGKVLLRFPRLFFVARKI